MLVQETSNAASSNASQYMPISVATLIPSETVGLDLFQSQSIGGGYRLYRGSEYPLTRDDLDRLRGRGVKRLFIPKTSGDLYQRYLRKLAGGEMPGVPTRARIGAMNEVMLDVLGTAFNSGDTAEAVAAADELADMTGRCLASDEVTAADLFAVLHHDYTTFVHSSNVALYAAMLARELGYDAEAIRQITVGGLLHDLGKLEIADTILCKTGPLDNDEFDVVKTHPQIGFRRLCMREDLSEGQMMMIYQHHERSDGRGYPVGIKDEEIHPWAKLCSVVDVFEALTSQRPYRSPMTQSAALKVLVRDAGKAFDPTIVQSWKTVIARGFKAA